ncbi:hypothetical protein K435DRAFT_879014 [Dendrothele bispora CBS 962.96]|uniref:Uncharacterized protein n=1 Tax=Dendrothele bispora (strain CBS 962.96) TaxID=1314807 RepID=A0A4S8KM19_DENBC|nr:hypothetical protein K435DRAFT_879014 [Dendrothele bispora CBS 962.96]
MEGMDVFVDEAKSMSLHRPEDAANLLCLLMKATRKYLNPHSKYATSQWYLQLLEENAELYALTKDAHEKSDFEELVKHRTTSSSSSAFVEYHS